MSIARYDGGDAPAVATTHISVTERDIALIERQAAILAKSSVVPLNNPADIAMIGMKALSLGVDPMAAFDDIYAIPSKGGTRLTISARMRVALARRAGCEVWFEETTDERAVCCLRRPRESRVHRLAYTVAQAKRAGLTGDNWAKHPAAMLRAAAARQLVNLAAQDVLLGIGGMGDVDLTAVSDLDGADDIIDYSEPAVAVEAEPLLSDTDRDRLLGLIVDLTDEQRAWLRQQMKNAGLPPVAKCPARLVADVEAFIEAASVVGTVDPDDVDGGDDAE